MIKEKKNLKRITLLFTPSALEKWSYEYRVETDKKGNENEKSIKWTKKRYKKRYIGWLCEHFNETLTIPKKATPAENWKTEKK